MERLFVYGTLAPGRANAHLLERIEGDWCRARVRGTLHPEGWGAALGYPALVLDEAGDEVEGYLFSSAALAERWTELDEFEGHAYERVETEVALDDLRTVRAFVYVLGKGRGADRG